MFGQSAILKAYVQTGLEGNLALQQQSLEIEKAITAIEEARSNLFPKIAFSPTYTLAAGGRQISFPIGDLLNPVYNTLNQLTASNNFPQVENEEIQFLPNNFQETKVDFQLPLFNANIKYNIKLKTDLSNSERSKRRLLAYELKYQIEAAYYQYLQSLEAIKVYNNALTFLNNYLGFNKRLVANDIVLKDVIYASEYEISKIESDKITALKNSKVAAAYFNFLINRQAEVPIEVDTALFLSNPLLEPLEKYQNAALLNRPEFEQLRMGKAVTSTLLEMQEKNAKRPDFYVGGNIGIQGFGYQFRGQGYALMQIGMNWDIFHGKEKRHKIEQTKIQERILGLKEQETVSQIELQVAQALFELEGAMTKANLTGKGVFLTQKLLDMINKKYENNDALYIEVLEAQNDHLIAELGSRLAQFDVWLKKSDLDKVSGL
jgi:outer membrane protein